MPSRPKIEGIGSNPKPRPREKPTPKLPKQSKLQEEPRILPQVETKFILRSVSRLEIEINRLWTSNRFIDIILVCDEQRFPCHRLIVAAASRLIDSLLLEDTSNDPIVILPLGVRAPIMKLLIDFMYTGAALVGEDGLQELVESAKLLQVTGLYDATTKCLECFVDVTGVSHVVEKRQTVLEHVSQLDERKLFQKQIDPVGYPEQIDAANQQNEEPIKLETIKTEDDDSGAIPINQGCAILPVATGIKESPGRPPTYDEASNTTLIHNSKTRPFCEYNRIKEKAQISESVSKKIVKVADRSTNSTSRLLNMFQQNQLSQELKSLQRAFTTNTMPSSTVSWTLTSKDQSSTSTQFVSTEPARTQLLLTNPPGLIKIPKKTFRVPRVSPIISKTTPLKVPMNGCRNKPSTVVRDSLTGTKKRVISPQVPQLYPRLILSRIRSNGPSEMSPSSKQAKRAAMEELKNACSSAHPFFLKLRASVPSITTTPHLQDLKGLAELEASARVAELLKRLNQSILDGGPESDPTNISGQERNVENILEKCEMDGFNVEEASFIKGAFPRYYAMLENEKQYRLAAEKARELGHQLLAEEEAKSVVTAMNQKEIEKVLCHPTISYFYDDDDEDIEESKALGLEAKTHAEGEEKLQQEGKRQESNPDEKASFYYSPEIIPCSIPKFRKRKYPPTLLPLSVMHAKQFSYNHKLKTEENGDINFKEDPSIFGDAGLLPELREGDPHSPNSVILRNPRCNQPRNYSTESLYNALMAVKYGDSIYRASRVHHVPRKTLRNWMKRFNIKSKYPMPKQLQDAANNNRKKDTMLLSGATFAVTESKRTTRKTTKRPARTCTVTSTATLSISDDSGFKGFPEGEDN